MSKIKLNVWTRKHYTDFFFKLITFTFIILFIFTNVIILYSYFFSLRTVPFPLWNSHGGYLKVMITKQPYNEWNLRKVAKQNEELFLCTYFTNIFYTSQQWKCY